MAYSLIFEANIPRHFVPPTTGCKSPQALWRDDSNSPISAEADNFHFVFSPLLWFTQKRQLLAKCAILPESNYSQTRQHVQQTC